MKNRGHQRAPGKAREITPIQRHTSILNTKEILQARSEATGQNECTRLHKTMLPVHPPLCQGESKAARAIWCQVEAQKKPAAARFRVYSQNEKRNARRSTRSSICSRLFGRVLVMVENPPRFLIEPSGFNDIDETFAAGFPQCG